MEQRAGEHHLICGHQDADNSPKVNRNLIVSFDGVLHEPPTAAHRTSKRVRRKLDVEKANWSTFCEAFDTLQEDFDAVLKKFDIDALTQISDPLQRFDRMLELLLLPEAPIPGSESPPDESPESGDSDAETATDEEDEDAESGDAESTTNGSEGSEEDVE